ncbi:MAG: HAD family hydrolase [Vicinamibacterales bacterium]
MIVLPDLGSFEHPGDLLPASQSLDGRFRAGEDGVRAIVGTRDRKVQFIAFGGHTMAAVHSSLGHAAYYPVPRVEFRKPVRAVLMDLDGTSVRSEHFWVWLIEQTLAALMGDSGFALSEADAPFVAGHSVSEHLQYGIDRYCPGRSLQEARRLYFERAHHEVGEILQGRGRLDAFTPAPGLAAFLSTLKRRDVRIALVTSGLHEKAWPEIVATFRQLDLGDPTQFYDAIITAGFPLRGGSPGTLGELSPKPHPWLYAEAARLGLGLSDEDRTQTVGIEDSGAGVCAVRLAGFTPIGMSGGTIVESGTRGLCAAYCHSFEEVLEVLF